MYPIGTYRVLFQSLHTLRFNSEHQEFKISRIITFIVEINMEVPFHET